MRRIAVVAGLAVAWMIAVALPSTSQSGSPNRVTMTCANWNKRLQVDPILQPGIQVSAHMHDFYGRMDVSNYMFAHAAHPPLLNYGGDPGAEPEITSCRTYGDWAGYWYPSPKFDGAFIKSGDLKETWQSPAGSQVIAPPFGMAFVAGSGATSEATMTPYMRYTCGSLDGPEHLRPVNCTGQGPVTAELTFPSCFDGKDRLAADWSTPAGIAPVHFAYPDANGNCPSSHPKRMATLITRQEFIDPRTNAVMVNPLKADGTVGLSFSSGPAYTYHGDYLDMWNVGLWWIIDTCLNGNDEFFNGVCPGPPVLN